MVIVIIEVEGGQVLVKQQCELLLGCAKKFLKSRGIDVTCFVSQIETIIAEEINIDYINKNKFFFPDASKINLLDDLFENLINQGDSIGAKLTVLVKNCPPGLGEPVFDKLDADLAKAIMSINAVKSVSIGNSQNIAKLRVRNFEMK